MVNAPNAAAWNQRIKNVAQFTPGEAVGWVTGLLTAGAGVGATIQRFIRTRRVAKKEDAEAALRWAELERTTVERVQSRMDGMLDKAEARITTLEGRTDAAERKADLLETQNAILEEEKLALQESVTIREHEVETLLRRDGEQKKTIRDLIALCRSLLQHTMAVNEFLTEEQRGMFTEQFDIWGAKLQEYDEGNPNGKDH